MLKKFSVDGPKGALASKKRPGVNFFAKANSSGLTNLTNQECFYI